MPFSRAGHLGAGHLRASADILADGPFHDILRAAAGGGKKLEGRALGTVFEKCLVTPDGRDAEGGAALGIGALPDELGALKELSGDVMQLDEMLGKIVVKDGRRVAQMLLITGGEHEEIHGKQNNLGPITRWEMAHDIHVTIEGP